MGIVGMDEQRFAIEVDIVFDARLARLDQQWRCQRIGRRDQPDFAGFMVRGTNDQPLLVGRKRATNAEALVILVVKLNVT